MALHQSSGRWKLGLALALTTASLWGILPIALKVVLQVMDVYTVTWFRFLVSFGLLAGVLFSRGDFPSWQKVRSARLDLLGIATLFLAANYLLYLTGLDETSPTNSQVIIQLAPVMMGLGALAIFRERYTLSQWMGLSILTLGLLLFFNDQLQVLVNASTQYLIGSGILVLAALTWSVYALAQKQLLQHLSSSTIMLVIYGGSALLFSPAAHPQQLLTLTPLQWGMLIFSGLNTFVAYGAFAEALDHWEASKVSAVLSLTPIITLTSIIAVSALLPTLLEPEHITAIGILGAVLVVCGSLSISLGKHQTGDRPPIVTGR
jgi:drug/metabolite transporter (DMT)-like permease